MSKPLDYTLIKKPHQQITWTELQIQELARCADPETGPMYFMSHYFFIQHPTRGKIQYQPFEYQERLMDTYHNNRFCIAMLPRQTGKSTTAAGYLLWYAMFVPDSTILIAAHKYLGAQEIMQRIRYAYENAPDFIRAGVTSYNKGSIEFENGSRIVAQTTTETTGRGMSITLLYLDEFAFVRPSIAREFWVSISPTLSTGGKAIITSTPSSDEDQFATIWKQANRCTDEWGNPTHLGINGFRAFRSYWHEHPDRDEAWRQAEMGRIGEERFRREHDCEFLVADETLISSLKLRELAGTNPVFQQGQVRWYKQPEPDRIYMVALDPSLGTGGDPAAIEVFESPGMIQVAEWQHNKTPVQKQIAVLREITQRLVEAAGAESVYYSLENNTLGEAALVAISEVGEENIAGIFLSEPARVGTSRRFRRGFTTTNKSKLSACAKLKNLVETDRMAAERALLPSRVKPTTWCWHWC
jgi:hypothetical protein